MSIIENNLLKVVKINQKCCLGIISTILKAQYSSETTFMKDVLVQKIPKVQEEVKSLREKHGNTKIGDITVEMIFGGMRGMTNLISEISIADPEKGVSFRGYPLSDCIKLLPKARNGQQPLPEGMLWLLFTGEIPNNIQAYALSEELAYRAELPTKIVEIINSFSSNMHPMAQMSAALTLLSSESQFTRAYSAVLPKEKYWDICYEDAMNLIAKVPMIAAMIYRNQFKDRTEIAPIDSSKDWSANFAAMMGFEDPQFIELLRLYMTIHSDHERGNVCAHACHLVGSALSDPYLSYAAGINGLAGFLHGRACEETVLWLNSLRTILGDEVSDEDFKDCIWSTINAGKLIPGYGHSILRKTDPRFLRFQDYAAKHLSNDPLFKLVSKLYKFAPSILTELRKVHDPWPNVDAHSGILLYHYGMTETSFYPVVYGVCRSVGSMASYVWDKALNLPSERPKCINIAQIKKLVGAP